MPPSSLKLVSTCVSSLEKLVFNQCSRKSSLNKFIGMNLSKTCTFSSDEIKDVLNTYRKGIAKSRDDAVLNKVPEVIRNFFGDYFKQIQSVDNICQCVNNSLNTQKVLLRNSSLPDQYRDIVSRFKRSIEKFTDDLVNEVSSGFTKSAKNNDEETEPKKTEDDVFDEPLNVSSRKRKLNYQESLKEESNDDAPDTHLGEVIEKMVSRECSKKSKFDTSDHQSRPSGIDLIVTKDGANLHSSFQFTKNGLLIAFIDGACSNNGKTNAQAGYGIWFSHNHPLNTSEPVKGPATNNNAEIQAATKAIKLVKQNGFKKILLKTDSQFLINCMTKWISNWKKNGWRTNNKSRVKNYESLIELDAEMEDMEAVKWEYVIAHNGLVGNEAADQLAKLGASRYVNSSR